MQKKQLLLLTALVLTSSTIAPAEKYKTKPGNEIKSNNIMQQLANAMWSYNENPTVARRTNFDNALQQITELKNKEWVGNLVREAIESAKWYDDIYMMLELIGAGGHLMHDISKRMDYLREEDELKAKLTKKALQYGFKEADYQQILEDAFSLGYSDKKRDQKQIDDIAQMLVSKKSTDRKEGQELLGKLAGRNYSERPTAYRQNHQREIPYTPLMSAVIACNTAWTKFYKDGENRKELDDTYARFSRILKAEHAPVNAACGKANMTPLMMAAQFGLVDIVKDLLAAGAHVHATDSNGLTALWYAQNTCASNNKKSCPAVAALLKKQK